MLKHKNGDSLYELGRLYYDRGDFQVAVEKLTAAADSYFHDDLFDKYLDCQNRLLRAYAETDNHEMINKTKELLHDTILREGHNLNAKSYYSLGLCASYKGQHDLALNYLQKSLSLALNADDKRDICYAINGIAIVYFLTGRYTDALKEIYNLDVFFQVLELPEVKISAQFINGHILREMKRYDEALDIFWCNYDNVKNYKNTFHYIYLLLALGITYGDLGDEDMGKMYLNLAKRTVDVRNMPKLAKTIDDRLTEFNKKTHANYDIVYDSSNNSVIEQKLGRVNFNNQFVLLDLMRLFLQNPGRVFSKEDLVELVWNQQYDPAVHDNKIYVTIKRLRKLIEPNYDKPKYIFRAQNGYYLNKGARVLINNCENRQQLSVNSV